MTPAQLEQILRRIAAGEIGVEAALAELQNLPYESLGFATVDHHRQVRTGAPEVIFGQGKTPDQIAGIARAMVDAGSNVLCTRCTPAAFLAAGEALAGTGAAAAAARHHENARAFTVIQQPPPAIGRVAVVCAGTSDLPVADEAAVAAEFFGAEVSRLSDVGVAGLHRLLDQREAVDAADVLIVVAGMEGALPSVVGGLVGAPIVAVPTSVGYGASFGGIAALLGMLNSCAAGVVVVNIDNGFGAAAAAQRMLRRRDRGG